MSEWQFMGNDTWAFGVKVRGVVRDRLAEIYFDESHHGREGGWRWTVRQVRNGRSAGGYTGTLSMALDLAEAALGVL